MSKPSKPSKKVEDAVLVISIPVSFLQRGGRKQIIVPPGMADWQPRANRCDNSLINALAKAHLWRRLIESGKYSSAAELSRAEGINESYLCRVLRLTLLAPDIVDAIWARSGGNAFFAEELLAAMVAGEEHLLRGVGELLHAAEQQRGQPGGQALLRAVAADRGGEQFLGVVGVALGPGDQAVQHRGVERPDGARGMAGKAEQRSKDHDHRQRDINSADRERRQRRSDGYWHARHSS